MENTLNVYSNKVYSLIWITVLAPFLCFCAFFTYVFFIGAGIGDLETIAMLFNSLLLFLVMLSLPYSLFLRRAIVMIDDMGLRTHFWRRSLLSIKWEEIVSVEHRRIWTGKGSTEVLEIYLAENNSLGRAMYILPLAILGEGRERIHGAILARINTKEKRKR